MLYKNGEEVKRESITVNNPMTYGTVTFYQSSYGQAASFLVTDGEGRVLYDDSIPLGEFRSTANPDAPAGLIELPQINKQINVIAPDENRANAPEDDDLQLRSGEMFVQVRSMTPSQDDERPSAVIDQGDTVQVGDVNITFLRERRYTDLQVASNPGIPIFFTAAFLLVGGLAVTFYFPHRRIRGIVSPDDRTDASTVSFAPLAKWDWSGKRDFERAMEDLDSETSLDIEVNREGENPSKSSTNQVSS